jgi:hypothetical protein
MQQTTSALICSIFYMLSMFRYAFSVFNLLFSVSPLIYTQYSLPILLHIFSYVNRLNCAFIFSPQHLLLVIKFYPFFSLSLLISFSS